MSHHPRFEEGLRSLRSYQMQTPDLLALATSSSPLPPRPAVVQRAVQLLTAAEAEELERLTTRFEGNRLKLLTLRRNQMEAAGAGNHGDDAHDGNTDDAAPTQHSGLSVAALRRQTATRCHVELLSSVWGLFSQQLRDGRILQYRDVGHLQDAIDHVVMRPS